MAFEGSGSKPPWEYKVAQAIRIIFVVGAFAFCVYYAIQRHR